MQGEEETQKATKKNWRTEKIKKGKNVFLSFFRDGEWGEVSEVEEKEKNVEMKGCRGENAQLFHWRKRPALVRASDRF